MTCPERASPDGGTVEMGAMDPAEYDFRPASAVDDPLPELVALRDAAPIAKSELYGGHWILTRYSDVHAAAGDAETFCSGKGVSFPPTPFPPVPPIEADPPLHRQYRMPLLDRFGPKAVANQEAYYRTVVRRAIDGFAESGEAEVISQLLKPMTGYITSDLLGCPEQDMPTLSHLAARIMANEDDRYEVLAAVFEYFGALHDQRTANPVDDIPSLLISLDVDGSPLTREQFIACMATLFVGGLDTTVGAGAHILEWLARRPEKMAWLRVQPDRIPTAVEEFLRYFTPLPALRRVATRDCVFGGHEIAEGETVLLHWMAANHDPEEFESPAECLLERTPNRHLAFGAGIHRCLGSSIARQELRVLLEELLEHPGSWELDPQRPMVRYPGIVRGVSELWLRFPASTSPRVS